MRDPRLDSQRDSVERILREKGFPHLHVHVHGQHLVIDSQDGDERWNRARLTRLSSTQFQLGMADHRGRWEATPFSGTLVELLTMLVDEFGFTLAPM